MTGGRGHQQKEKAVSVRHFMGAHIKLGSPFASVLLLQTNSCSITLLVCKDKMSTAEIHGDDLSYHF